MIPLTLDDMANSEDNTSESRYLTRDEARDLGFGSVVARESRQRLLNRDGSFSVERTGLGFWAAISPYHALLTMSWVRFLGLAAAFYLTANAVFAWGYVLCGPEALQGMQDPQIQSLYLRAYFFSVQTLATIGYGHVAPSGLEANLLVTIESLVGLLGFALVTGMLFARFSRPTAKIVFSNVAVIAPYRGITAFEFRIANQHNNQIIELEAKVLYSRMESSGGRKVRRFYELNLERRRVTFFPLSWTVVHPIDGTSPLRGVTDLQLEESDAEFLILLTGIDETFSQTVHARSSYKPHEIVWNARFADIFRRMEKEGTLTIDVGRIHQIEKVLNPPERDHGQRRPDRPGQAPPVVRD
jgi:inward rectifier potassium channel